MEMFYDYLREKYFIDYEDKEIKDISQAIGIFLGKLRDTFNELSEVLRIECLVPCGSMEEKTTIRGEENMAVEFDPSKNIEAIEFDCLAVLMQLVPDMEVMSSCPGYKKLTSRTLSDLLEEKIRIEKSESYQKANSDHTKHVMDTIRLLMLSDDDIASGAADSASETEKPVSLDTFISQQINKRLETGENVSLYKDLLRLHNYVSGSSKSVSTEFMVGVDSAAEALCQASNTTCDIDEDIHVYKVDLPTGTLQYGRCLPGCQLAFTWKSKFKPGADRIIYADFVPAFRVPETASTETGEPSHYLVAKGCRTPYCDAGCWRLSHCLAEIKDIQITSQCHRDVYKFLKIFNHSKLSRRSDNALKSYHLKTALLKHINSCQLPTADVTHCMGETLAIVNSYIENGKVPHWRDPNYSLVLNVDTCHGFVPVLLQFVFYNAVRHAPTRLYLTIRCEVGRGKQVYFHKAGCRLSNLVCEVIEGRDCYKSLESEIENTLLQAADLPPIYRQTSLNYSLIIEDRKSPDNSITIYQRCANMCHF